MESKALSLLPSYQWLKEVSIKKKPVIQIATPKLTPEQVKRFETILSEKEKELIFILFLLDLSSADQAKTREVIRLAETPGTTKGFMAPEIATTAIKYFVSWQIEDANKTQRLMQSLSNQGSYANILGSILQKYHKNFLLKTEIFPVF